MARRRYSPLRPPGLPGGRVAVKVSGEGPGRQDGTSHRYHTPGAMLLAGVPRSRQPEGDAMNDHVYKTVELTGSSATSSDDAVRRAIERASRTIREIRWFQVTETRGHVEDGKVAYWQVTLKVGFTLEA